MNLNLEWLKNNGMVYPSNQEIDSIESRFFSHSKVSRRGFFRLLKKLESITTGLSKDIPNIIEGTQFKPQNVPSIFSESLYDGEIEPVSVINVGRMVDSDTLNEWRFFFRAFLKKDGICRFPEEWVDLAIEDFANYFYANVKRIHSDWIFSWLDDELSEKKVHDSPSVTIFAPNVRTGENIRMAEELNFLIVFILRGIPEIGLQKEMKSWLREMGNQDILDAPMPKLMRQYRSLFIKCFNSIDGRLKYLDFNTNLMDCLLTVQPDEIDDPNYILMPFTKNGVREMARFLQYQEALNNILVEILTAPHPELIWNINDGGSEGIFLFNRSNGMTIEDFEDKENIYFEIFFAHHFPKCCKTDWIVREKKQ